MASAPCPDTLRAGNVCPALPYTTRVSRFPSAWSFQINTLIPGQTQPSLLPSLGGPTLSLTALSGKTRDAAWKPRPTAGQGQVPGEGQEQVALSVAVALSIFLFIVKDTKRPQNQKEKSSHSVLAHPPSALPALAPCPHTQPASQPGMSCSSSLRSTHPDRPTLASLPPLLPKTLAGPSGDCMTPRAP